MKSYKTEKNGKVLITDTHTEQREAYSWEKTPELYEINCWEYTLNVGKGYEKMTEENSNEFFCKVFDNDLSERLMSFTPTTENVSEQVDFNKFKNMVTERSFSYCNYLQFLDKEMTIETSLSKQEYVIKLTSKYYDINEPNVYGTYGYELDTVEVYINGERITDERHIWVVIDLMTGSKGVEAWEKQHIEKQFKKLIVRAEKLESKEELDLLREHLEGMAEHHPSCIDTKEYNYVDYILNVRHNGYVCSSNMRRVDGRLIPELPF